MRRITAGLRVALIERALIGGECAYWARASRPRRCCVPPRHAPAAHAAGLSQPALDWPGLRDYRDHMIRRLDDTNQVAALAPRFPGEWM